MFKVKMCASLGYDIKSAGKYILHCEPNGRPHAVAVEFDLASKTVSILADKDKIRLSIDSFRKAATSALDSKLLCHFGVHPDDTILAQNENAALLLLLAGSAGDTDAEVDSDCDSDGPRDDEWESVVTAGDDLLSKLRLEVVGTTRSSLTRHEAIMIRCPLCPFRCMSRWSHWATHLFKYHTETQQFCCSGTKQLRIAIALFDSDRARGIGWGRLPQKKRRVTSAGCVGTYRQQQ